MNPKLLAVLDKISAILKENDLAGSIVLTDGQVADFRLHMQASWSCAFDERDAAGELVGIRIRCTPQMIPDKETRKAMIERTTSSVLGLIQAHEYQQGELHKMAANLSQHFEIRHVARLESPRLGDLPGDGDTHSD